MAKPIPFKPSYALANRMGREAVESTPPPPTPPTPYQTQCLNRLTALTDFCFDQYNIDPTHTRLIMSTLVPSNYLPIWLIYETQRTPFWNHLNAACKQLGMQPMNNLSGLRSLHIKFADQWYREWMKGRHEHPKIFIDTYYLDNFKWRKIPASHAYWLIAAECARVSVPAMMAKMPREGADEELLRLVRMVIQPHDRTLLPKPIEPGETLNKIIHSIPRLNKEMVDGEPFYNNIVMIPGSHAALYGRGMDQLVDADYYAMMQVIRGSIRQNIQRILHRFFLHRTACEGPMTHDMLADKLDMPLQGMCDVLSELHRDHVIEKSHRPLWHSGHGRKFSHATYKLTALGQIGAKLIGQPEMKWWREP